MKNKIDSLTRILKEASDNYYKENVTQMPDTVFDQKLKELAALEEKNPELAHEDSPTKRVGSDLADGFKKVTHEVPMISIDNVFTWEDFQEYRKSIKKELGVEPPYTIEFKLDGLSLGVIYENGVMVSAVTRGNGAIGDEVTENARTIADIPLTIPFPGRFEARGEVVLSLEQFKAINKYNSENGLALYKNPRNAASGILKSKDPRDVARKRLNFVAFGIVQGDDALKTQQDDVAYLGQQGFRNVNKVMPLPSKIIADKKSFDSLMRALGRERTNQFCEMDGLVIKVTAKSYRKRLGKTAKHVKWARAFKFKAEQAKPVITKVAYQTGRTGKITPVAMFEPVPLAGTTVRRATLHNFDELERLDLYLGDTVYLEKGGEIIPKVVGVDKELRHSGCTLVVPPVNCPCCGQPISRDEDVDTYCINEECPDRLKKAIEWFVSRKCVNIMDIGPSLIEKLVNLKVIHNPLDIFSLNPIDFEEVEGMQAKSVRKVLDNIDKARKGPAANLLAGLGIRHVGVGTSERVMGVLDSFSKIASATAEEIEDIPDVGKIAAKSIYDYFQGNPGLPSEIIDLGITSTNNVVTTNDYFKGQVVVVTGSLYTMDREGAHAMVKMGGGRTTGSVSGKTTLLVVGEEAGSKLAKAKKLGVRIMTETEFIKAAHEGLD